MRSFTVRPLAFAALVPALFLLSVIPGCSNESEGERCESSTTSNDDCESGLVCTAITPEINRCCYSDGHVTDSRCALGSSGSATSHGGGSGISDAGASSAAGDSSGGSSGSGGSSSSSTEAGAAGLSTALAGAGGN